ncbi:hypothetical protein SUDANB140_06405 [Streptomyces sp. enrichment culture]
MVDGQWDETDGAAEEGVIAHHCTVASGPLPHGLDGDHICVVTHSDRATGSGPEPQQHTSPDAVERLWIVDGTLIPVRDRKVGASSHNYRFSVNVQVIVDAETRLVVAAARPVPGNTADAKARRDSGLAQHCESVMVLGDGAYINTGLIVPHRKRPGRPLLKGEEEDNAQHRKVRARVEHTFSRMKNYKILRDCRQRGDGLHHAVQAVARMHKLALAA